MLSAKWSNHLYFQKVVEEAIVLAGGLGTRLSSKVPDLPKAMAPIRGRPFLEYQLKYLANQGIMKAILAVGHKHEVILDHFGHSYSSLNIKYSVEDEPLGTGGAVKKALRHIKGANSFVINGDTMFEADLAAMTETHLDSRADVTIGVKDMRQFDRYGTLRFDDDFRILHFEEKTWKDSGYINAGIYLLKTDVISRFDFPARFSLEKDLFEKELNTLHILASPDNGYFIDIGIPTDFERAQDEFARFKN